MIRNAFIILVLTMGAYALAGLAYIVCLVVLTVLDEASLIS